MSETVNPSAELAARQALIDSGKGAVPQDKPGYLFGIIHMDINVGNQLGLKAPFAFFEQPMLKLGNQNPKGLGKLLAEMGFSRKDFAESFAKVKEGAGAMNPESGIQVANISQAELGNVSHGLEGGGSSFASMVSNGPATGSGGMEV